MSNDPIKALNEVSTSFSGGRTKVGRIRELLPEIEQAQKVGVSLQLIAEALKDSGFPDLNIKCLQNLLYQARHTRHVRPEASKAIAPLESPTTQAPKINVGIDAESIISKANKAAQVQKTSRITLALLRKCSDQP